jgi:hypothetical protein
MFSAQQPAVYEELVDVLADGADPARLMAFQLSQENQSRLDYLLEKNRQGTLTTDESAELDAFEHFEHLVRLLKARMLKKQAR